MATQPIKSPPQSEKTPLRSEPNSVNVNSSSISNIDSINAVGDGSVALLLPSETVTDASAPVAEPGLFQQKRFLIGFYSAFLLFSSVGNSIYSKKMTNHMLNYPYFLSQFTTAVYLPIFGSIVMYEWYFTDFITIEQTQFPKYKFFIMGVMDALAGIFTLFGGVYTSGNTQGLLFQMVVPVTMILSYIVLKERCVWVYVFHRYKSAQMIGAGIILGGVIVVLLPKFLNTGAGDGTEDKPLFNLIFLIAVVPMAFSTIYKELAFNDIELDVNYLQYWVAVWQFLFGFVLIPLNTLAFLGPNQMPWNQLPNAIWNGLKCLGGVNTIVENCGNGALLPCDDCGGAWIPTMLYLMFNCGYNVFIMLVVKEISTTSSNNREILLTFAFDMWRNNLVFLLYIPWNHGSAALLYIIMTLRLPIINMAFSVRFVQDPPEPLEKYTIIGLVLIIAGLSAYRYGSMPSVVDGEEQQLIGSATGGISFEPFRSRIRVKPRDKVAIRSTFYSRLGVISSPGHAQYPPAIVTSTPRRSAVVPAYQPPPLGTPRRTRLSASASSNAAIIQTSTQGQIQNT